ncbi:hypothetical protein [Streptomyces sp. NPDC005485]|uniref:protein kinase domain-containing protein n=1 Tax=Streptomyces sp. NPDC005485 TaxID=3155591 RepID=UPI0033B47A3F
MVVARPWRLPRSTEVREVHRGRCGRTVLARLDGEADAPGDLVAVRYVPAALLIHRPRADAFHADLRRLTGLAAPEAVAFRHYVHAPRFASAYGRWAGAVGGALVSDAVEGSTLALVLEQHGTLPAPAALTVFRRTLRALAAAHDRGLVHGDVRPGKVLVHSDGTTTLTGLGLAALTTGAAPGLRAPELWRGAVTATPEADVYAACCVLHVCLTGELPFTAPQLFTLMARHSTAPVPSTALPEPLHALFAAGLAKEPALRPPPDVLLTALRRAAGKTLGRHWEERGRATLETLAAPLVKALLPAPGSAR